MSPQLYMSMHGLNNLINNNVQHQRLDDNISNNNNNVQLQHYNLIDIHHLIATSYNHHVNSTYAFHITVHQHIFIPSCNISSTSYSYNNHQYIYTYLNVIIHLSSYSYKARPLELITSP